MQKGALKSQVLKMVILGWAQQGRVTLYPTKYADSNRKKQSQHAAISSYVI